MNKIIWNEKIEMRIHKEII